MFEATNGNNSLKRDAFIQNISKKLKLSKNIKKFRRMLNNL